MNYGELLRRAWRVTLRYRALWLIGFILALTTTGSYYWIYSWDTDNFQQSYVVEDYEFGENDFESPEALLAHLGDMADHARAQVPDDDWDMVVQIGVTVLVVAVLWAIAAAILRYTSEAAAIRMVDDHEQTGKRLGVRQGLRLGWSRTAWRLFLVDLVLRVPLVLLALALLALAALPTILWFTGSVDSLSGAAVASAVLAVPVVLLILMVNIGVVLVTQFARRACAVDGLGAVASARAGLKMVTSNLQASIIVGLVVVAVGILWSVVWLPLLLLLFPVEILAIVAGGVAAGLPAVAIGAIGLLFLEVPVAYAVAGVLALPIFLLVALAPMHFLNGLVQIYISSLWTMTYRTLTGREPAAIEEPVVEEAGPGMAMAGS